MLRSTLVLAGVFATTLVAGVTADTPKAEELVPAVRVKAPGFYLQARSTHAAPGSTVLVDVFAWKVTDLRGFEVHPEVKGGSTGSLTLQTIAVDDTREDYLFAGAGQIVSAMDEVNQRFMASLMQGGVDVAEQAHMVTLTYQVPKDASGTFTIGFKELNVRTIARDSSSAPIVLPSEDITATVTIAEPRAREPRVRSRG